MKGSLTASYGLADVVRGIYVGRRSGILALQRGEVRKQVYFKKGSIDFSDSNDPEWRFGTLLVRRGKLRSQDLEAVLNLLGPGKRIGMVLRDLGFLSDDALAEAVGYQIAENIYPVFSWTEGEFAFTEKEEPTPSDISFEMSTANVVMEGVRRIASIEQVRSSLGPTEQVVTLGSNPLLRFQSIFLQPKEGFILSRIDGLLTIDEIAAISPVAEEDVLRCLYGLRCTGILDIGQRDSSAAAAEGVDIAGFFTDFAGVEHVLKTGSLAGAGAEERLTAEQEKERADILEFATKISLLDHYGVLGVAPTVDTKAVRKAYYSLAKRYHPDRHHKNHLANLQDQLEAVFVRINEAYETLKDPNSRQAYDRGKARSAPRAGESARDERAAPDAAADHARRAQLAESSFREGRSMFEHGDYYGAIRAFQIAVQQSPERAAYRAFLGRALGKNPKWRKEAEDHLLKAIELEPSQAEHYAQLGAIYEAANLHARADRYFDEALKWDPRNETALVERRKRSMEEDKKAGGMGNKVKSLFHNKEK